MPETTSPVETSVAEIATLLGSLDAPVVQTAADSTADYESKMVGSRLGVANSLFTALRHKHAPTAAHSLRVALGCSSWGFAIKLDPNERELLEVAALLHDIGKIGAPDNLLLKPGPLVADETQQMDQFRISGLDILGSCCPSREIVEIIRHSTGWYDGSRPNYPLSAGAIPRGARMLAIVDAYDSMTTDQVYRRAMSRERAMHELFSHAGTQFDAELVRSFSELEITVPLHRKVVGHWLEALDPAQSNQYWQAGMSPDQRSGSAALGPETLFQQKLLDNMHDAVIFVDRNMQIMLWNRAAERLTGIGGNGVLGRIWSPRLVRMRDPDAPVGSPFECPAAYCIANGVQSLRRLLVAGRNGTALSVNVHVLPVVGHDGATHGAAMILHDASGEASLEEQCQNLHERATKDPLTQVANRAQFDQTHEVFVKTHVDQRSPCSLIICDIDRFKNINDTFGHPAGDEVLRFFGQLLKSECRTGDLVARYGGEEFVMLCTACGIAQAADRAEELRKAMCETPQTALNGEHVTVSFGVTEIQPGDTTASMLNRADRALLEAKRLGRNLVMQLGSGWNDNGDELADAQPTQMVGSEVCVERKLLSSVPVNIAIEKLKGFVLDHHAEILSINADKIELQMAGPNKRVGRRNADRAVPFLVKLVLSEERIPATGFDGRPAGQLSRTHVSVTVRLKRSRDRRVADVAEQATAIALAVKSYLMASDAPAASQEGKVRPAGNMGASWFKWRK